MSEEFDNDFKVALNAARAAHSELLTVLSGLTDEELDTSRRGGWTIRRVLQHIHKSYGFYLGIILGARGLNPAETSNVTITDVASPEEADGLLREGFEAIVAAAEGVDEDTFYRLVPARDGNEYSVLSTIDGVAAHDHEHTEQIKAIANASRAH